MRTLYVVITIVAVSMSMLYTNSRTVSGMLAGGDSTPAQQQPSAAAGIQNETLVTSSNSDVSTTTASLLSLEDFTRITKQLLGPDEYGPGCPQDGCGCPKRQDINCPRHYNNEDMQTASINPDQMAPEVMVYMDSLSESRQEETVGQCGVVKRRRVMVSSSGAWCLKSVDREAYEIDGIKVNLTIGHVKSHEGLCEAIHNLIEKDGIKSMSDIGAGIGQYGACIRSKFPSLTFHSYDGAANVEAYTSGLVKYVDFTLPLHLPRTDWILSLEVGEHIPSKFEGMFIRNLHAHNCKGIILSWATFIQVGGTGHINLHDNDHIKTSFTNLGYYHDDALQAQFRNATPNIFFEWTLMIFRRVNPVC